MKKQIRYGIIWLGLWLVLYALLISGIWLLYAGWLPGADSLLGGRDIHSFAHYRQHFTGLFVRLAVVVTLLVLAVIGFKAWVRCVGGWRKFLPRFAFLLAFTALLAELLLRMAFALPGGTLPGLQDAKLLADAYGDETYWVLQTRLAGDKPRDYVQPILGWGQKRPSDDNPLGLRPSAIEALAMEGSQIYFYGDSFVHGMPFNQKTLPEMVAEQSDAYTLVNLGVRGYGVDQMYLKARELGLPDSGGEVWLGILTWDLDRAYLEFTYGQKPRYQIVDGELTLPNLPLEQLDKDYVASYEVPFRSWLIQAVRRHWQARQGIEGEGPVRDEKIEINRAIIREWLAWCSEAGIPLRVILFHTRQDLALESWRNEAVIDVCAEFNIPLFNTADVLLPYLDPAR